MPGRIVLDERGIEWRTMFSGRRLDWSEVAYAGSVRPTGKWSRAYVELADIDGAPAMARVWIPGSWTVGQGELVERINAPANGSSRT